MPKRDENAVYWKTLQKIEDDMIRVGRAAYALGANIAEWSAPTLLRGLDLAVKLIHEIQKELTTETGPLGKLLQAGKFSVGGTSCR